MQEQITDKLLMVRPVAFHRNEQTAVNNYYQKEVEAGDVNPQEKALEEFDDFVVKLREKGVDVTVVNDTCEPSTPDSIFPNNWVSFHEDGTIGLFPMFAENRRHERRADVIEMLKEKLHFHRAVDFTHWESKAQYLEGTGSLLLDRKHKLAYAAISERTMEAPLAEFCEKFGYEPVSFHAYQSVDGERLPIYHTNVMMCLGEHFVVICMESIDDQQEREKLMKYFAETGKEVIEITEEQKENFAGNMLQVKKNEGERFVGMSSAAFHSLSDEQQAQIVQHGEIIHSDLSMIEKLGGGSARCMMAEVFAPDK